MPQLRIDIVQEFPNASASGINPFTDSAFPHPYLFRTYWRNADNFFDLESQLRTSGWRFDYIYFVNGDEALKKMETIGRSSANHFLRGVMAIKPPTTENPASHYAFTFAMNWNSRNQALLTNFGSNFNPSRVRVITDGSQERDFNF